MKQEIIYSVPQNIIPRTCKYQEDVCYHVHINTGDFIHTGDEIAVFVFYKTDLKRRQRTIIGTHSVFSNYTGYAINDTGKLGNYGKNNVKLLSVYSTLDELISDRYQTTFSVENDSFSGEQVIIWNTVAGSGCDWDKIQGYRFGNMIINLNIKNGKPTMTFYRKKNACQIKKSDSVSFRFDDGQIITHVLSSSQYKTNKLTYTSAFDIEIHFDDIPIFKSKGLDALKLEHGNGDSPETIKNEFGNSYTTPLSYRLFKDYFSIYDNLITELGLDKQIYEDCDTSDACFVYLMKDSANGYHKIGISKRPDYRENTLQSEKPSIELLCAKNFPSREIAKAFESALHKVYGTKRIRGEWFNLSEYDVEILKKTLS